MSKNLESILASAGNTVAYLRNLNSGPNVFPVVPPEFSNWRDEQIAWTHTCVLFDLSYHMVDLRLEGPDALKLLTRLGINSFKNFKPGRAKQFVPCSYDGYVIGDVILFYLEENVFNLVGRIPTINWVMYHGETGDYNVKMTLDERSVEKADPRDRVSYRYQVQGPNAMQVIEKAMGKAAPDVKFFHLTELEMAGHTVGALRHGMAGQPGFELFGPYAEGEAVKQALLDAGEEFGLRQVGARAYSTNTLDSGWIPSPLPAIYTGEKMKGFREWLGANSYEARASIGGSFVSDNIEDYYLSPWDLGYGHMIKFDHDFIGREALEKMAEKPHRERVMLMLNPEDLARVQSSQFDEHNREKFMEFPNAVYAMHPYDRVTLDGKTIGLSTWIGYSANFGEMLTIAMLDPEHAVLGKQVNLVWGEEEGGTRKPKVERHVQSNIRAVVGPLPFSPDARGAYAHGWREKVEKKLR